MRQLILLLAILFSLAASTATGQVRCHPCPPRVYLPFVANNSVEG